MLSSKLINITKDRAVLHNKLRNTSDKPIYDQGEKATPGVYDVLEHNKEFSVSIERSTLNSFMECGVLTYFVNPGFYLISMTFTSSKIIINVKKSTFDLSVALYIDKYNFESFLQYVVLME
ncbi:hypothetical protein BDC45DRAFT_541296 [Circinella umbellata]|nr:hypothetical protein BDC45DRAFT_541296 [Circinella umbellata]